MTRGRVLVIGGAGYVRSRLVPQLLQQGYTVRVLDLMLYGDRAIADLRSHPQIEIVCGDMRDIEIVARCMSNVGTEH